MYLYFEFFVSEQVFLTNRIANTQLIKCKTKFHKMKMRES